MISILKNTQKLFVCAGLIFYCQTVFAQNQLIVENIKQINTQLFCLTTPTDTIHFIKYDTINEKKPLFLFLSGSLPMPLIVDYGKDYNNMMATNSFHLFDKQIFENFNVVDISQPNVPPIILYENLDNQGAYKNFSLEYLKRNVAETFVTRANEVINCLLAQEWIDRDSIFVYGHSQGAYIAARVAAENEAVKAIAFSSTNPFGRYQGMLQTIRDKAISGVISEEDALTQINQQYEFWNKVCYEDFPNDYRAQLPATWKSFSQSVVEILANLKQPLFVVYGTKDYHSVACELLPIYFGFSGKTNYKLHPMLGRGHNFESFDENGNPHWDDMKWQDVTIEFMNFIKN
ncbi:MAG: alpha/beta hydrolase [Prevotellaceae bacterium]|nr:alpha/beta hydrolase [Prevotellaceae bacterium]